MQDKSLKSSITPPVLLMISSPAPWSSSSKCRMVKKPALPRFGCRSYGRRFQTA